MRVLRTSTERFLVDMVVRVLKRSLWSAVNPGRDFYRSVIMNYWLRRSRSPAKPTEASSL